MDNLVNNLKRLEQQKRREAEEAPHAEALPQDYGLRFQEGYVSLHNPLCLNFGGCITLECCVRLKSNTLGGTGNEFGETQVLITHGRPDTCEDGSVFLQISDGILQVGVVVPANEGYVEDEDREAEVVEMPIRETDVGRWVHI